MSRFLVSVSLVFCVCGASAAHAQQSAEELAKQLSNPIASLISVPFQLNYDEGYGPDGDGNKTTMNVQPVVPISINETWNIISRTIVPLTSNDDVVPDSDKSGVGNTLQSFWLSPKSPTSSGWVWGAGAAIQLPTSTNDQFGEDQWALGPTAVALRLEGPWTYGALANHLWDVSGDNEINNTFMQPFLVYTFPSAVGIGVNSETSYDWEAEKWSIPLNFFVSKVLNIGNQPIQIQGGVRYWVEAPSNGPDDFGLRATVTYMFPK